MLNVVPVAMSGVKQRSFITVVKLLMDEKWLRLPANIKGIRNQFLKYRLPEEKLAQDIVSTFLVLAGLLWALGYSYEIMREAPEEQVPAKPLTGDRPPRPVGDGHARAGVAR